MIPVALQRLLSGVGHVLSLLAYALPLFQGLRPSLLIGLNLAVLYCDAFTSGCLCMAAAVRLLLCGVAVLV
jgi:hypothetical protein